MNHGSSRNCLIFRGLHIVQTARRFLRNEILCSFRPYYMHKLVHLYLCMNPPVQRRQRKLTPHDFPISTFTSIRRPREVETTIFPRNNKSSLKSTPGTFYQNKVNNMQKAATIYRVFYTYASKTKKIHRSSTCDLDLSLSLIHEKFTVTSFTISFPNSLSHLITNVEHPFKLGEFFSLLVSICLFMIQC